MLYSHILNLVSKSLLRQFDVKKVDKSGTDIDDDEKMLLDLAGDIEGEESDMAMANDPVDGEMDGDDNLEGWVDEVAAFTPEGRQVLEESIRPVKRMLVKVR